MYTTCKWRVDFTSSSKETNKTQIKDPNPFCYQNFDPVWNDFVLSPRHIFPYAFILQLLYSTLLLLCIEIRILVSFLFGLFSSDWLLSLCCFFIVFSTYCTLHTLLVHFSKGTRTYSLHVQYMYMHSNSSALMGLILKVIRSYWTSAIRYYLPPMYYIPYLYPKRTVSTLKKVSGQIKISLDRHIRNLCIRSVHASVT